MQFNNRTLLDGGISDPIPIKKAQLDGFNRSVVILTRNKGYRKKPSKFQFLVKRKYPQYNGLQAALASRYQKYNDTISYLEEEEKKGNVLIIQPQEALEVGRMERDPRKLEKLYLQGFEDAKRYKDRILNW